MSASRDRKEAAKRLGIALQAQYRAMLEAVTEDEIQTAAVVLGGNFNANIEFIIWCLKEYGGIQQMPFERLSGPVKRPLAPNNLPETPAIFNPGTKSVN